MSLRWASRPAPGGSDRVCPPEAISYTILLMTAHTPERTPGHPLAGQAPTKIIAVHVSYRSRAMERGRLPQWPSYFLKPPSTLAADGDPVLRPPWCELLAFEGEVALVIGTRASRVSAADAWGRVRWVTAAPPHHLRRLPPPAGGEKGVERQVQGDRRVHAARTGAARRQVRRPGAGP